MLKKICYLIIVLMLLLTGCGKKVVVDNPLNAINETLNALKTVKSYKTDFNLTQDIKSSSGESKKILTTVTQNLIKSPLQVHSSGTVDGVNVVYYLVNDDAYIKSDLTPNWVKLTGNDLQQSKDKYNNLASKPLNFDSFKNVMSELKLESSDTEYTLNLNINDKKEEVLAAAKQFVAAEQGSLYDYITVDNIKDFEFKIILDKSTILPKQNIFNVVFELKNNNEVIIVTINYKLDFTDFNKVETVKIPKEVKENAVESGQ